MVKWRTRAMNRLAGKAEHLEVGIRGLTKKITAKLGSETALIRKIAADLVKEIAFEKQKRQLISGLANEVSKEVRELAELRHSILKEQAMLPHIRALQAHMIMGKNADPAVRLREERGVESTLQAFLQEATQTHIRSYEYRNTLISQKRVLETLLGIVNKQLKWIGITDKQIKTASMLDKQLQAAVKKADREIMQERKLLIQAGHKKLGI